MPHINVGDLLYAEVAAKTPLGLEAQRHMDGSKTVPDRLLMRLLLERLQHADCRVAGWVLDGFPHTRKQVGFERICSLFADACSEPWTATNSGTWQVSSADCALECLHTPCSLHTSTQAEELTAAGHVPDKVVLLEGPHALLLNRVKYRRIDYNTGGV